MQVVLMEAEHYAVSGNRHQALRKGLLLGVYNSSEGHASYLRQRQGCRSSQIRSVASLCIDLDMQLVARQRLSGGGGSESEFGVVPRPERSIDALHPDLRGR